MVWTCVSLKYKFKSYEIIFNTIQFQTELEGGIRVNSLKLWNSRNDFVFLHEYNMTSLLNIQQTFLLLYFYFRSNLNCRLKYKTSDFKR